MTMMDHPDGPGVRPARTRRKPRIVVTGEFSAGKTRLINGLLGRAVLPSNVTSTALPPVWIIGEGDASFVITLDGERREIASLDEIDLAETLFYVKSVDAPVLRHFDLIDTPGNSDPNMPAECWQRMLQYADTILWCTGATQAWRQSEKAACSEMPVELTREGTLLITQADRLPDERAKSKVLRRVGRDASAIFPSILSASMLDTADVDRVRDHLVDLAGRLGDLPGGEQPLVTEARGLPDALDEVEDDTPRIMPRRPWDMRRAPVVEDEVELTEDDLFGEVETTHSFPTYAEMAAEDAAGAPVEDETDAYAMSTDRLADLAQRSAPDAPDEADETDDGAPAFGDEPTAMDEADMDAALADAARAEATPAGADEDDTGVRNLWDQFSAGADQSDPAALQAALNRFIAELETRKTHADEPLRATGTDNSNP